jgi:hypothetical protein
MQTKTTTELIRVFILVLFVFSGCRHMVKTDIDSYLESKQDYKRKRVVFTTDLKDLLHRYELYRDKEVELTAPVSYFGKEDFPTFYLNLTEDGKQIRAYEDNYKNYVNRDALQLLIWAKSEEGAVTVRGKLKEKGIELNQLAYNDYVIDTDVRPYRYRHYYRPYYEYYYSYPFYYRPHYGYRPHFRHGYRYRR